MEQNDKDTDGKKNRKRWVGEYFRRFIPSNVAWDILGHGDGKKTALSKNRRGNCKGWRVDRKGVIVKNARKLLLQWKWMHRTVRAFRLYSKACSPWSCRFCFSPAAAASKQNINPETKQQHTGSLLSLLLCQSIGEKCRTLTKDSQWRAEKYKQMRFCLSDYKIGRHQRITNSIFLFGEYFPRKY